jgi:hypothetical protein
MLEHLVEGSRAIAAPREVVSADEKVQLRLVDARVAMQGSMAKEVDPVVEIMKAQILDPVEVLHLETRKKPSSSTY